MKSNPEKLNEPSFEQELQKLQEAVSRLESDELTLEDAFEQFENGWGSYRGCLEILSEARKRVEVLIKSSPAPEEDLENASEGTNEFEWKPFDWPSARN
jgi:exodeoxyribonuclease VII small subunit